MTDDHRLASELAVAAGRRLVALREQAADDPSLRRRLGDAGDMLAHNFLLEQLGAERPDDALLSEEGADDRARLAARRAWIVDPLDGTREYAETGRSDWAVHVALVIDGAPAAGAVSLPALGLVFGTDPPAPTPADPIPDHPRIVVSRTRPPAEARLVAHRIDGRLIPLGSAGAKAMAVVMGEAEAYVHAGGQWEWDSAAPVAVALAAGLHASRLDGSPLRYNRPDPYLPDFVICRQELATTVLDVLAGR